MTTTIKHLSLLALSVLGLAACSDDFLVEKKNFEQLNADLYNYEEGINGRIANISYWVAPDVADLSSVNPSCGLADEAGKSTEEYAGFSKFVDPRTELSASDNSTVPDFFKGGTNIKINIYGQIFAINDCIEGIQSGTAPASVKDAALGQLYFYRAWRYYNLFKWYGGVPLVDHVIDPSTFEFTDRSTAKATFEFIRDDLRRSADLLRAATGDGGWKEAKDYGRITTAAALALKGRLMTFWCSPIFNRADNTTRWQECYDEMAADLNDINAGGVGLYQESGQNAKAFANMFVQSGRNPEAVLQFRYNNVAGNSSSLDDTQKNNKWERNIRPANTGGSGLQPSQTMIDLFPMADGRRPATLDSYTLLTASQTAYDATRPFIDRDPRFYRTFAFPGFRWAYNGDPTGYSDQKNSPAQGSNYVLWNYVWYDDVKKIAPEDATPCFGGDNLLDKVKGVYVRKKSDDLDANPSPLYTYQTGLTQGAAPFYSAAPLIELRYAEVLLNMAEVACGAGHMQEAMGYLQQIRQRAGYTADCGLDAAIGSDRATCFSAILYERQIEFAYEGKRFDDCRRWMLYDGGATQPAGAPQTWNLTGFAGNTCTYLGLKPLNDTRRENIVFRVTNAADNLVGGKTYYMPNDVKGWEAKSETDPLKKNGAALLSDVTFTYNNSNTWKRQAVNPKNKKPADIAVNLNKGVTRNDDQMVLLLKFYDNLKMKVVKGDNYDTDQHKLLMKFLPKYYILGLDKSAQQANKGLPQTPGWETVDGRTTYDPLAE